MRFFMFRPASPCLACCKQLYYVFAIFSSYAGLARIRYNFFYEYVMVQWSFRALKFNLIIVSNTSDSLFYKVFMNNGSLYLK